MEAVPVPRGTVVCTVSNLIRAESSALPPDGVCDLLFFDSFYKDNKNILADGYRKLEPNARFFLDWARRAHSGTKYGASFAFTNTVTPSDLMTKGFNQGVLGLVQYNARNFGFLNLYREFSTPTAVRNALLVLKQIDSYLKRLHARRSPFYVLGLSIDIGQDPKTVEIMSGRYYAPKRVDTSQRYLPFEDCTDFPGPYYNDPTNVCPSVAGADWKFEENNTYHYEAVLNEKLNRTFTFDTVDSLKAKMCEVKRYLTSVSFGLAAYDIDFDSSAPGCAEIGIKPGAFNRLSGVRQLSDFLINKYAGYVGCLDLNFTTSRTA
ncbi:hypothetical protein HPB52_016463 [Rhipicephalus sanguineus]|uniref:Uncharacterized protein n=1 Tax=Rhipicephalus sanguineus TaxID=34632 RepID=A0A9D4PFZ4_RHISA|nr:hypothetical protein HPB52_016463 [Rhipicephalus sanguineus]